MTSTASRALRRAALLLAVASAFAGCSSSEPPRRTIEVRMHHSKYLPATIQVAAGTTVDFVIVNQDPIAHEFIIGTEAEQRAHETGRPDDPHLGPGEAAIAADATYRLSYTFAERGTLLFACHQPGHYSYGMVGAVNVS